MSSCRSILLVTLCAGIAFSRAEAQPATSQPATSGDPKVDHILTRLEVKGQAIKGIKCKVVYKYVTVEPVEDETIKEGELLFARSEPNSKFLVEFKKIKQAGTERDTGEYYLFDGLWLTERNDKAKSIVKREIARPGEKKDPFKIGSGPFPLPFGQKREDILANFKVTLAAFALGDPRNVDHLHCVPLPGTDLADKYTRVEMYVDRQLELPVRIVTERVSDGNRIEVDFKDVNAHEAPAGSRFVVKEPAGYELTIEPLDTDEGKK